MHKFAFSERFFVKESKNLTPSPVKCRKIVQNTIQIQVTDFVTQIFIV